MKVAITGATGFIGRQLVVALESSGHQYVIVTRRRGPAKMTFPNASAIVEWNLPSEDLEPDALEGLDGVIHMAGAPVAQRWTADAKRAIEDSRVQYTRALVHALGKTSNRPGVLVSFSAIGYYGVRDDTPLAESAEPGTDFLARVCRGWEGEATRATEFGIRVVNPRIGIVLGRGGGALAQMLTPFRMGVGGPIGNGRQWMSWIHVSDVVGIALEALTNQTLSGPVNATAPRPATNRDFSKALGRALHRPAVLPIPVFGLKLLFGGFADVLATGQRVVPEKALSAGYRFRYPDLEEALAEAVS
jgi:uncharacterized protein (TIGR01777 family)